MNNKDKLLEETMEALQKRLIKEDNYIDDENYDEEDDIYIDENDLDYTVEIIDEDPPYISGYATIINDNIDYEVEDRGDLDDVDLWLTGWTASPNNLTDGPFKSFEDIDMVCMDNEKEEEYFMPTISEELQSEYLKIINKWIEENKDELLDY